MAHTNTVIWIDDLVHGGSHRIPALDKLFHEIEGSFAVKTIGWSGNGRRWQESISPGVIVVFRYPTPLHRETGSLLIDEMRKLGASKIIALVPSQRNYLEDCEGGMPVGLSQIVDQAKE